jgi:hypothetical protein
MHEDSTAEFTWDMSILLAEFGMVAVWVRILRPILISSIPPKEHSAPYRAQPQTSITKSNMNGHADGADAHGHSANPISDPIHILPVAIENGRTQTADRHTLMAISAVHRSHAFDNIEKILTAGQSYIVIP